jgi:endonuclease III related protein
VKPSAQDDQIRAYYHTLHSAWGCQHWWPARTRFEVTVGAYLTQNTSWKNVEAALRRLRSDGALNMAAIRTLRTDELESLIRPAGYFRQKAARLKTFVAFVDQRYRGSLRRTFAQSTHKLRDELLTLSGVGPETADSILLYAGQHPVFVVDAYTRRILDRHRILPAHARYEEIKVLFERSLADAAPTPGRAVRTDFAHPPSPMSLAKRSPLVQVYNDMHGLIVAVGKHYCFKSNPDCEHCPLRKFLPRSTEN